jgi:hypothetical protein
MSIRWQVELWSGLIKTLV